MQISMNRIFHEVVGNILILDSHKKKKKKSKKKQRKCVPTLLTMPSSCTMKNVKSISSGHQILFELRKKWSGIEWRFCG